MRRLNLMKKFNSLLIGSLMVMPELRGLLPVQMPERKLAKINLSFMKMSHSREVLFWFNKL